MASLLARRHGLRLYSSDTRTWDHVDRLIAVGSGRAERWNATTPPRDRFALIRESNLAVADQVRAFYARGDAQGDPEAVVRRFACECGHPACEDFFEAPVAVMHHPASVSPSGVRT